MFRVLSFLVLVLVGCQEQQIPRPTIEVDSNEVKPFQLEAQELLEQKFAEELQVDVYWTTTLCPTAEPGDDRTAVVYRGGCTNGLTFSCDEIYVAWRGTIASSAFVHELGHCLRLTMGLDGDAGHEDKSYWEVVSGVNKQVRENGW